MDTLLPHKISQYYVILIFSPTPNTYYVIFCTVKTVLDSTGKDRTITSCVGERLKVSHFLLSLWGIIIHFQVEKKLCPLPARALIMTNSLGKAFGPIINTSPMRSHLCLRPGGPVPTLASHIRINVSEQISIHTHFMPLQLSDLPKLPRVLPDVRFAPSFMNCYISTVTIIFTFTAHNMLTL